MSTEVKKCAHPACNCVVTDKDNYCSQSCKDAGDMTEIHCNCEHPPCQPV